jgi:hypothetical protein
MISSSLEEYLATHLSLLRARRFYEQAGTITAFRKQPQELGGSVTVSHDSIAVEA